MQTLKHTPEELTNEYRLLLICARKDLTPEQLEEASSVIARGLDWDLVDRHSQDHGLEALLYWHLQRNFPQAVPRRQERRLNIFENGAHNLFLSGALLKIIEALRAAGIRALAYKGPVLAASLYGDIALREMSDLDILIERTSFPGACEVLTGLGYRPSPGHSRAQEKARLRSDCECEFYSADGEAIVDLHWRITPPHLPQRFCFDELWDRRRIVTLGQKPIPTFSAEDTALVLAVHGGKHLWCRLSWLADFAESLRQKLDWQALRARAREARAERMLLLAMALVEDIFQVQIRSEFAAAIFAASIKDDDVVQTVATSIARRLFEDKERDKEKNKKDKKDKNDIDQATVRWLTLIQLADSHWDGIRSAARFTLGSGPREWQAVRLPDSLFALYHLLRIANLLRHVPAFFPPGSHPSRDPG